MGLDLLGGSYLLLEIDNDPILIQKLQYKTTSIRNFLKDKNITFTESVSPLQKQIQAFIDYCESSKLPDSDMAHTKRVTYIVECMEKSLKTGEVICPSKKY